MQTNKSFNIKLEFGEQGEREVAQEFMNNGYYVMPLYQFKNKDEAPKIFCMEQNYISPDLICMKDGKTIFIEVKRKNQFTTRNDWNGLAVLETGYHEKHFKDYKKVQEGTGIEVFVVFNHNGDGMFITPLVPYKRIWNGKTPDGCYIQKPTVFYTNKEHKPLDQFFNII